MLSTELTESLRKNLLRERQVANAYLKRARKESGIKDAQAQA